MPKHVYTYASSSLYFLTGRFSSLNSTLWSLLVTPSVAFTISMMPLCYKGVIFPINMLSLVLSSAVIGLSKFLYGAESLDFDEGWDLFWTTLDLTN